MVNNFSFFFYILLLFYAGGSCLFFVLPLEGAGVGSRQSVGALRGLPLLEQQPGQAGCDPGAGTAEGAGSQGAVSG